MRMGVRIVCMMCSRRSTRIRRDEAGVLGIFAMLVIVI